MATGSIKKVSNDSASGYCKMPDGTLIQWGSSGGYSSGNSRTDDVTLSIPFVDNSYRVVANGWYNGSDESNYNVLCIVNNTSLTKFKIHIRNISANYTNVVLWLAIGRWK